MSSLSMRSLRLFALRSHAPILFRSASSSGGGGRRSSGSGKSGKSGSSESGMVKNEGIKFPSMRVVFKDPETGANGWKLLNRSEALAFAKKMSLDLVMVDAKATPPVCRLANFGHMLMEKRSKEKEKKVSQKAKVLKEIYIKSGIDPHDLGIKLNKCQEFLEDGHQVKVVLMVNKATLAGNPLALDETTLKVIERLENHAGTVQQPAQLNPLRKDFLLNPKTGVK